MFTQMAARAAQQLVQTGMPKEQADILLSFMGNCISTLVHRGQTEFNYQSSPNAQHTGHALTMNGTLYVNGIDNFIIYDVVNDVRYTFQNILEISWDPETCTMTTPSGTQLLLRAMP